MEALWEAIEPFSDVAGELLASVEEGDHPFTEHPSRQ
jgi:hypothetical protein